MKKVFIKLLSFFIVLSFVIASAGCTKDRVIVTVNLSAADKIAGLFSGSGKYLPGGINLGSTLDCQAAPSDYRTKYQSGTSSVNITKLSDNTVTISFLTGPYPVDKYTPVTVTETGNMISFGSLGFYDTNTKVLLISGIAPNFGYSTLRACQVGVPYYSSTIVTSVPPRPDLTGYFTIKRYEFSGTKQ